MSWIEMIPSSFGEADKKFALHQLDCERAVELLKAANSEGVSYLEYCQSIEDWLKSEGVMQSHLREQMERVKDLENYFCH